MSRLPRNPRAGVTLLELLISLWVMVAAALILSSTLGLTGRMLNRVIVEAGDTDFLINRLTLRRWIEAMPPAALLTGTVGEVRFTTFVDEPPLTPANLVLVQLTEGPDGIVASLYDSDEDTASLVRSLRLSPKGTLTIRYFGVVSFQEAQWHDTWSPQAGLPQLISFDYQIDNRSVPPLTAIPALWAAQREMSLSSPVPPG